MIGLILSLTTFNLFATTKYLNANPEIVHRSRNKA